MPRGKLHESPTTARSKHVKSLRCVASAVAPKSGSTDSGTGLQTLLRRRVQAVIAGWLLFGLSCTAPTPLAVKIAVSEPMGVVSALPRMRAVELALDDARHRAGKVRVDLLVLDSSDLSRGEEISPEAEMRAAQRAVADPTVVAYMGSPFTALTKVSLPITNRAGMVQISAAASWPGLTRSGFGPGEPGVYYPKGRRNFFRLIPSDDIAAEAAAQWTLDLGFKRIFVVDNGLVFGRGMAGMFEQTARDAGLTIVGRESLLLGDTTGGTRPSPAVVAAHALATEPDLVYFGGTGPEGGDEFLPALRQLDPAIPVMSSHGLLGEPTHLARYGIYDGVYVTAPSIDSDSGEAFDAFRARYRERFGEEPLYGAIRSYETARVLLRAIELAATPTRDDVLTAAEHLGDFSGVLGTWHFDANGDTSLRNIACHLLSHGEWVRVRTMRP